jgi:hypothetical protein
MAAQGTQPASQAADQPPAKASMLWVQGLVCGALLAFATPTALVLGVLMAPALICLLAERGPRHGIARAVALCCGAACLAPVWHLWMSDNGMGTALSILAEPLAVVLAWGSGACAWALCQLLPVLVRTAWDAKEAARAKAIQKQLALYREEWDFPEA